MASQSLFLYQNLITSPFWCWCSSRSEASWGAALQAAFVTSGLSAAEQIWPLSA